MSDSIAVDKSLSAISIGDTASFEKTILQEDLENFAVLSGDFNPLHNDEAYAQSTPFKRRVTFGFLLGAYVSQLIGMQLPGRRALILKESLDFKKPVYIGDTLLIKGVVISKSDSTGLIEIKISIMVGETVTTEGIVHVRVRAE